MILGPSRIRGEGQQSMNQTSQKYSWLKPDMEFVEEHSELLQFMQEIPYLAFWIYNSDFHLEINCLNSHVCSKNFSVEKSF